MGRETERDREREIDFIKCTRQQQLKEVNNCKVINGKCVAVKPRVLVLDWEMKCSKRRRPEQVTPNVKWWRLKESRLK